MDAYKVKQDIFSTAASHVIESLNNLSSPIEADMNNEQLTDLLTAGIEQYYFEGIHNYYDCYLVVCSAEFPSAGDQDFSGCSNAIECLTNEANEIADEVYREAVNDEIQTIVDRIIDITDKAQDLGYDGEFQVSNSSVYGWEAHNYETDCGICIWSDEKLPYAYNPRLLEGELYAIEGQINGVYISACWEPVAA